MPYYILETHGEVRELYSVEAADVEDARRQFERGDVRNPFLSEASSMEVVRVTRDEDDD